jgi:drug/metabolite transporter (DMT)-like permease
MFISGVLMGFVGIFVNSLSIIPTFAIVSLRGLFGCLWLILILSSIHQIRVIQYIFHIAPGLLIGQSVAGVSTIFLYFVTIQSMGYAYAAFMLYTGPIIAVFLIWIFLHKRPSRRAIFAFALALIGVIFLLNLWDWIRTSIFPANFWLSIGSGTLSGISLGAMSMLKVMFFERLNQHKNTENTEISIYSPITINLGIAFYNVAALILVFGPFSIHYYPTLTIAHWMIALGLGLIPTAIAFSIYNIGLQRDEGGDVLIFSYSEPLVGAFLTAIIDHALTWTLAIGGSLIIGGNLLVALKKSAANLERK